MKTKLYDYAFKINIVVYTAICLVAYFQGGWFLFMLTVMVCLRWFQFDELIKHTNEMNAKAHEGFVQQIKINDILNGHILEVKDCMIDQLKINQQIIQITKVQEEQLQNLAEHTGLRNAENTSTV